MTEVRYIRIDEILAIARKVNGTEHSVRDMGLLVSAIERPRTNVFGAELYPALHEKAAALLHSVARNHALIDGNKPTAWLAMRVFLRLNGVSARTAPPPVSTAGPFVEDVAQDDIDVPVIAKCLSVWFPIPDAR
ncbi:type II toxin-antitoxin system death-on-curing family toxin [Streptomyces clavifer]|uniref:type II toxin-antitoxin system death-on-curing family toxin n=1 Tax=Streptomyces clavifer TaxID=68188 RepID=UPI0036644ED4